MRSIFSAALIVFAIVFGACNAIDHKAQNIKPTSTPYPDGARRITIDEFEKLVKEGKAFIVDVRTQDAYDVGHIPGARLIPSGEIANHIKELPRDKTIVTYCS